jgi:hypothetical protein
MATCHGCKKTIWIRPIKTVEDVGYTFQAGNIIYTHREPVTKCMVCHLKSQLLKAVNKSAPTIILVVATLVLVGFAATWWLPAEKQYDPEPTGTITAIDGRPVPIPPKVNSVLTRR